MVFRIWRLARLQQRAKAFDLNKYDIKPEI
jgi:hypothetical protein